MKKLGSTLAESAAHVTSPPIAARGFTLAETLITLGIIGIIAAITIPSLITKYRRTVASTKLKKLCAQWKCLVPIEAGGRYQILWDWSFIWL